MTAQIGEPGSRTFAETSRRLTLQDKACRRYWHASHIASILRRPPHGALKSCRCTLSWPRQALQRQDVSAIGATQKQLCGHVEATQPSDGSLKVPGTKQGLIFSPETTMITRQNAHKINPEVWQNAAVLIDKDTGWTSFDICGKLRRVLKIKKVGHAGTLDPGATGLVIVCTGRGTKSVDTFVQQEKEYTGILRLGEGTPSFDAELEVNEWAPWEHVTDQALAEAAERFTCSQLQVPPMYSAIKVKGERLYKAARKGRVVEREARPVTIMNFQLHRTVKSPQDVSFRVRCSKGTYIRALVHDLGVSLGTVAHMTALRRTGIGNYLVEDAWTLHDLQEAISQEAPDRR